MLPRILALALLLASAAAAASDLKLMPWPKKVARAEGALAVDTSFHVAFAREAPPLAAGAAARMLAQLSRETGIPLDRKPAAAGAPAALVIDCPTAPASAGDESYTLDVAPAGARLRAATATGVLRGLATFLQLVEHGAKAFEAPAVHIEDAPRFPWRGLLIDVTSHFQPVAVIERTLDAMEAVKLNVFHWHLTDDQGFRVESKVFPKLHKLGSDGDYYTQADIRHLVAYAHDRGIRIVPEFDMPGHCATWLIGYPELGSAPGPYSVIHTFGIYDPTLDPTRDRVYTFIDALIGEMATLFPGEYIHIGGDEVTGKHWKENAAIQVFMKTHNLGDQGALHAYFNQRVEKIVRAHGKKMMGWDEVLNPALPKDVIVQSWRDHQSLATAVKAGHRALLSFGYYLDHLDTARIYYDVDPLGGPAKDLTPAEAANVLGGEACMWTEYTSPETIDSRIWPKTAAIAERLWSPRDVTDPLSMYTRLDEISRRLDYRGALHNSNYAAMLARLADSADLRILADTLQPLGIEDREKAARYSQSTPLNRLVDAARAESVAARRLEIEIALWNRAGSDAAIRRVLTEWRNHHERLLPALESNFLLREAILVSAGLSRAAAIGLEALDYIKEGKRPADGWLASRMAELDDLAMPKAETALAAVSPVRALVRAAALP